MNMKKYLIQFERFFMLVVLCLTVACSGHDTPIEDGDIFDPGSISNTDPADSAPNIKIIKVENPALVAAHGNLIFKLCERVYIDDGPGSTGEYIAETPKLYRSTDGGVTFENIALPENISFTIPQRDSLYLSQDDVLLWAHIDSFGDTEIKIYRSADLGNTFTVSTLQVEETDVSNPWKNLIPPISLGESNGINWVGGQSNTPLYLMYIRNLGAIELNETRHFIHFFKSADNGLNFSTPPTISSPELYSTVAAAAQGEEVFLFYVYTDPVTLFQDWNLLISHDGAEVFTKTKMNIADYYTAAYKEIVIRNQNIYLTALSASCSVDSFCCYILKSTDGGRTFLEPQLIAELLVGSMKLDGASVSYSWEIESLLVYGKHIYVLFGGPNKYSRVHIIESHDEGVTFSEPQRVTNAESHNQWSRSTVDGEGNIYIFWTDEVLREYWQTLPHYWED